MRLLLTSAALALTLCAAAPTIAFAQDAAPAASSELNAIARAQTKLKELGLYRGEITGELNMVTERAIARYQERYNLAVTGTLTPETLSEMFRNG